MGGHPWWYVVPYEEDVERAMNELRGRELAAGRYNPVTPFPRFPDTDKGPTKRSRHRTFEEAIAATDADGTRSILDMFEFGRSPGPARMSPVPEEELEAFFGTARPTREQVEGSSDFFDSIDRGEGRYILLYEGDTPTEILFVGYSFD